jgi:hypothetical protein
MIQRVELYVPVQTVEDTDLVEGVEFIGVG